MKTYRDELTAAIRGNARLRRRLDAKERRIKELEQAVRLMVTRADINGRGDEIETVLAAERIGWRRDACVARKFREAMQ
jgi:hypothetical protein